MIFKKYILFFIGLFLAQLLTAQNVTTIKATVDKNKILIGEPIELKVEANFFSGSVINFPSVDTIEHFEFLGEASIDTVKRSNSTTITGVYKITSFDSGHWVIPSFIIAGGIKTDTILVDVVFSDFDPKQEYHDIKDILDVEVKEDKKNWWWYVASGVLALALLLYFLLKKKKVVAAPVPKKMINAYEEAMRQLDHLQNENPAAKQYYSTLTEIFRLYIFRRKGLLSLQKTTDDLVIQLRDLNLNKEQFDKLSQALRLSDFVKFAKYIPTAEDDRSSFNEIKNSIIAIEKSEVAATKADVGKRG